MLADVSAKEAFDSGLAAYRTGDFVGAVRNLLMGLGSQKDAWEMRLYLGMAYARLGQLKEAKAEFLVVRDFAVDADLRKKAASAIAALNPSISQQRIKRLSEEDAEIEVQ